MARPLKTGLDYFPLDVHLDDEIELFEAECGLDGFAILVKLWQKIYSIGYFLKWSSDTQLLFAKRINSDINKVDSVINACLNRNIFNKILYDKHSILTSKAIQKRYFMICKDSKRKGITVIKDYFLVNGDFDKLITEFIELTPEETPLNHSGSTQRKVKEIESKVKENKVYTEIIDYLNLVTNSKYKVTDTHKSHIDARIKEGATLEEFKSVIDKKNKEWTGTQWQKFLRPQTLFGTKFDSYLNEKEVEQSLQGGKFDEDDQSLYDN